MYEYLYFVKIEEKKTFNDKDDLHGTVCEVTWLQSGWQKDWETSPPESWMDIPWRQTLQESWKPYQKDDYILIIHYSNDYIISGICSTCSVYMNIIATQTCL